MGTMVSTAIILAHYIINEGERDVESRVLWMRAKRIQIPECVKDFKCLAEVRSGKEQSEATS